MSGNVDLDRRVARLEREARVWRGAVVVSMLLAAVAWLNMRDYKSMLRDGD